MSNDQERTATDESVEEKHNEPIAIEHRWPIALAIGSFIVITIVLQVAEQSAAGEVTAQPTSCSTSAVHPGE